MTDTQDSSKPTKPKTALSTGQTNSGQGSSGGDPFILNLGVQNLNFTYCKMSQKVVSYTCPEGTKEREGLNMEKEIYIDISITEYGNGKIDCVYAEQIDDDPMTLTHIDLDKARKMIWELVLAGGVRKVHVNQFDRDIVSREAYIFLAN